MKGLKPPILHSFQMGIPLALFSHEVRAEGDATYSPRPGSAPYKN